MEEQCPAYRQHISQEDWEATKRQCQSFGGGDGAAHRKIGTTSNPVAISSAAITRENKSHIEKLIISPICGST